MQRLDKIKPVKVGDQQTEDRILDLKLQLTGAFNLIGTGKPEMPVGGQKRMLAEKRRNSKAY